MKRLGRDAAELTALADHLTAHGPGLGDAGRPAARHTTRPARGRMLFGFFAAMAETERESIREATLEGLDAASRKGKHGGRPPSSPTTCCTPCCGAARRASPSRRSGPT
ncbi:recombinase family protein [Streptomyces sp. PCS3-D2]|uniref:recombinase family protein n=1 Tax=Streptomyces sp. PCS3-D2 TaxID=1460244 RepID=UPI001F01612D|nr:recombinase family protein [Streptomyces sp. PCS3-D2]WKV76049.1 recombinase family protein [Streptomyces sp. PCS3-D2]